MGVEPRTAPACKWAHHDRGCATVPSWWWIRRRRNAACLPPWPSTSVDLGERPLGGGQCIGLLLSVTGRLDIVLAGLHGIRYGQRRDGGRSSFRRRQDKD